MAASKSSQVNRKYKTKYKVQNWREYERGLRSHGDITIWLSEEAIAAWTPPKNGRRGGQRRYSNLAILTALTLRVVFGLPLRQTEGFLDSLLSLMGLDLNAPDHTTLSRRNRIVKLPPRTRAHDGPIHLIVDSTGLKILGSGEWSAHKYKTAKKRRDWRKLHIGVDEEGFIVAAELTASSGDDASTVPALLDQIEVPIRRFTADGAYDHRSIYERVGEAGTEDVVIVIPPRRCAVSAGPTEGPWAQREAALERIRKVGRREWKKESGYRQQSRVENGFFRYKSVLGGGLQARNSNAQKREAMIGCHTLNRMAELGRPKSYAVAP
ncbi:MAG: IS5 family transposase [Opitutales bacterium]